MALTLHALRSRPPLGSRPEKRRTMPALQLILLAVVVQLAAPEPAFAYMDPSAGSLAIQVVMGLALGGLVTLRRWRSGFGRVSKAVWAKLRRF